MTSTCRDHSDGGSTCVSVRSCSSAGQLAIIASLVVGPAATAGPERASAGTVVIIHDQEPGILNPFLSEGNGYTVALVMNKILDAGTIYNNKVQVVPELLDGSPEDPEEGAVEGHRDVQADREVERRQADHRRGLRGHVQDDHEPELGHRLARGLGGHREDQGEGQDVHRHLQAEAGVLQLGVHPGRPDPARAQGGRPGLQQALVRLDRHLERCLQVRELAEGHAAHDR